MFARKTRKLSTVLALAITLVNLIPDSEAKEPVANTCGDHRSYMLKIYALHTLSGDQLHQEIAIHDGSLFFVSTRVGRIRWTFAGDVGKVTNGRLALMMKSKWYESEKSHETAATPRLLEINGKADALSSGIHTHGVSLAIREMTVADELPDSGIMQKELQRMIRELQKSDTKDRTTKQAGFPCHVTEPSIGTVDDRYRRFVLTVKVLHTLTGDELQQDLMITEGDSFFVSTQAGKARWTFAGVVHRAVDGHLPILMRSKWYKNADASSTLDSPRLVKINAKSEPRGGSVHGQVLSLSVREATDADNLPGSDVMRKELQRMIRELEDKTAK